MRTDNTERDKLIVSKYIAGASLKELSKQFKLSRERVHQITRDADVTINDRQIKRSDRGEFLGLNISEPVKDALRVEAMRRGVSMSALGAETIRRMLHRQGYPVQENQ